MSRRSLRLVRSFGEPVSHLPVLRVGPERDWWMVERGRRVEAFNKPPAHDDHLMRRGLRGIKLNGECIQTERANRLLPLWSDDAMEGGGAPFVILHRVPAGVELSEHKDTGRYCNPDMRERIQLSPSLTIRLDDPAGITKTREMSIPITLIFDGLVAYHWQGDRLESL